MIVVGGCKFYSILGGLLDAKDRLLSFVFSLSLVFPSSAHYFKFPLPSWV